MTDLTEQQWRRVIAAGRASPMDEAERLEVLDMLRAYHEEVTRQGTSAPERKERVGDSYAPSKPEYPAPKHPSPSRQATADAGGECPSCGGDEYLQPCPGCNGDVSGVKLPLECADRDGSEIKIDVSGVPHEVAIVSVLDSDRRGEVAYLDDPASLAAIHTLVECRRREGLDTPLPGAEWTPSPRWSALCEILGCDSGELVEKVTELRDQADDLEALREHVQTVERERDEARRELDQAAKELKCHRGDVPQRVRWLVVECHDERVARDDWRQRANEAEQEAQALREDQSSTHQQLSIFGDFVRNTLGAEHDEDATEVCHRVRVELNEAHAAFNEMLRMRNEAVERAEKAEGRADKLLAGLTGSPARCALYAADALECSIPELPYQVRKLRDECERAVSGEWPREVMGVVEAVEARCQVVTVEAVVRVRGDVVEAAKRLRDAIRSGRIKPPAARLAPETVELLRWARRKRWDEVMMPAVQPVQQWFKAGCPDLPDADGGE